MRLFKYAITSLPLLLLLAPLTQAQEQQVRVASYNIRFLSTAVNTQGDRLSKLSQVISLLDADVIGLQEIKDRAALNLVFPPDAWTVVIDDDSADEQDVAVAVRKPFKVVGINADLDADDSNFLFPGPTNDSFFPNRRDVLFVEVGFPAGTDTFFVMVGHLKARVGGRAVTDPRREGAARLLVEVFKQRFDDKDFILLGDLNDNPDDRSMNILETGDPNAAGGAEEIDGPFMINLMEPLVAAGHVSHGRTASDIVGGKVNTIDATSRQRNNAARGTNQNTGDILFDQILIPVSMGSRYVAGSAAVFDHEIAVRGNDNNRASDHLPVFAEFVFGADEPGEPPPSGVRIVSLLPNPNGTDAGREEVVIANSTQASVNLSGWKLKDRTGNQFALSGSVAAGGRVTIILPANNLPLNNDGDDVILLDPQGQVKHQVSYTGSQAQSGQTIVFP
jgi:endonuclease/exonuclease/phosphatase family metal-dependent hydrolase